MDELKKKPAETSVEEKNSSEPPKEKKEAPRPPIRRT